MKHPKTTTTGILTLAIAILTLAQHVVSGGFQAIGAQDIPAIMAALAGIGLITASDGGA